ncbi:MAG: NHL repeat-containing protein [Gammaproteobacteria bacterium]|nr:NHL repeat-containing protein [Gammaproteobacteria bacterium]MDH5592928.1 NHL repeat-containing protein [Gammaproteobacteria bacterium]
MRIPGSKHFLLFYAVIGLLWSATAPATDIPTHPLSHIRNITATANGKLSLPTDVALDKQGRLYVVDSGNHRIAVFSNNGQHLFNVGKHGSAPGEFNGPTGIDVGPDNRFYVADKNNHRIQVFSQSGELVRVIPITRGKHGITPVDVAVSPDGETLYITGNNNHHLMSYTIKGKPVHEWGGEGVNKGEFRYPATIAVSPQGNIHVVDVLNARVQKFTGDGKFLVQISKWGVLPGQLFRPKGIALDSQQHVYVGDSYMGVIQVFDKESRFIHVLGNKGEPQRFDTPLGMAISRNGHLYVAEMIENKISVYKLGR